MTWDVVEGVSCFLSSTSETEGGVMLDIGSWVIRYEECRYHIDEFIGLNEDSESNDNINSTER